MINPLDEFDAEFEIPLNIPDNNKDQVQKSFEEATAERENQIWMAKGPQSALKGMDMDNNPNFIKLGDTGGYMTVPNAKFRDKVPEFNVTWNNRKNPVHPDDAIPGFDLEPDTDTAGQVDLFTAPKLEVPGKFITGFDPYDIDKADSSKMSILATEGREVIAHAIMENRRITLTILGEPKAQKRHRSFGMTMGSKNVIRQYDPSHSDKGDFLSIVQKNAPQTPWMGPVRMDCSFYFQRPKSHYGTGKNARIVKDSAPLWYTSKPDRDNLDKFVLDSLSKIYFKDDASVCAGEILKFYDENPRTEIKITFL